MWLAVPRFSARKTPNWVSWEYYEDEVADDGCKLDVGGFHVYLVCQLRDVLDEEDDVDDADRDESRREVQYSDVCNRGCPDEHEEEHDRSEVQVQLDLKTAEELVLVHQVADHYLQVEQVFQVIHVVLFT
jgi:hypothetical protein